MTKYYFKYLIDGRKAPTNRYQWSEVGKWTVKYRFVYICSSGFHATKLSGLGQWFSFAMDGSRNKRVELYLLQAGGKKRTDGQKIVCGKAKLVRELDFTLKSLRKVVSETRSECDRFCAPMTVRDKGDFVSVFREMLFHLENKKDKEARETAIIFFRKLGKLWKVDFGFKEQKAPKSYAKVYK